MASCNDKSCASAFETIVTLIIYVATARNTKIFLKTKDSKTFFIKNLNLIIRLFFNAITPNYRFFSTHVRV